MGFINVWVSIALLGIEAFQSLVWLRDLDLQEWGCKLTFWDADFRSSFWLFFWVFGGGLFLLFGGFCSFFFFFLKKERTLISYNPHSEGEKKRPKIIRISATTFSVCLKSQSNRKHRWVWTGRIRAKVRLCLQICPNSVMLIIRLLVSSGNGLWSILGFVKGWLTLGEGFKATQPISITRSDEFIVRKFESITKWNDLSGEPSVLCWGRPALKVTCQEFISVPTDEKREQHIIFWIKQQAGCNVVTQPSLLPFPHRLQPEEGNPTAVWWRS